MTGRVRIGEFHTLLCQAIDIGRVVKRTPEAADIAPPHVVHQKENHIGPLGRLCRRQTKRTKKRYQYESFHGAGIVPNPASTGNVQLSVCPALN